MSGEHAGIVHSRETIRTRCAAVQLVARSTGDVALDAEELVLLIFASDQRAYRYVQVARRALRETVLLQIGETRRAASAICRQGTATRRAAAVTSYADSSIRVIPAIKPLNDF